MDNSIRWAKMNLPVSGCFCGQTTAYLKERRILEKGGVAHSRNVSRLTGRAIATRPAPQ
jgi:hypothetical protein